MRSLLALCALSMALLPLTTTTADAGRRDAGGGLFTYGQDLLPVTETAMPGPTGQPLTLCHLVDRATFFFVPIYTTIDSYAFSEDGCAGDSYLSLPATAMLEAQAAGLIPADVPQEPQLSIGQMLWGHAAGGIIALLLLVGQLRKRAGRRSAEKVATHAVVAMANVAAADGYVDEREVQGMAHILSQLQGRSVSPQQVSGIIEDLSPDAEDLAQVGQGLSGKERRLVLQAALTIAAVDGELHPDEYDIVSGLAQQMKIGASDFRASLQRVSGLLRQPMPAPA